MNERASPERDIRGSPAGLEQAMSVLIKVDLDQPPPVDELVRHVDSPDLYGQTGRGDWPEAALLLHRQLVSTRQIEVAWQAGELEITIRVFASSEDIDLALRLASAIALEHGRDVWVEGEAGIPPGELQARFDRRAWSATMAAGMRRLIERKGTVELSGPQRPAYLGPRVLAALDAGDSAEPFFRRAITWLRRVQWIEETEGYRAMGILEGRESGRTVAIWDPRYRAVLPLVDVVAIYHQDDHVAFAAARVPELVGDRATWLDDEQLLLEAMRDDEIDLLVSTVR